MPSGALGVGIINYYLCANLLLIAAAIALAGIRALNSALPRPLTYRHLLSLGRAVALAALLLPFLAIRLDTGHLEPLRAQVWSAPTMHTAAASIPHAARIELGFESQLPSLPLDTAAGALLLFFAAGLLVGLVPLVAEVRSIRRAIRDAHLVRHIGRTRVLISDTERVPFAVWIPGSFFIVLPACLLLRPADFRMALQHEGQHHRQRDTRYLYAMLLGRAFFGLNPAAHWLMRHLFELQEFTCDEAIVRRGRGYARCYCSLLLRVAETALPDSRPGLRAFMAGHRPSALARRVEAALRQPERSLKRPAAIGVTVVAVTLLAAMSVSIASPLQDRRLSLADAQSLAAAAQTSSGFPLTVNEAVLAQLNLLLGTPDGRAFLRAGMVRMRAHESHIRPELNRYSLPPALLAVPLVESGYRNLPASNRESTGAGLWMFIGATARNYGLHVSPLRDDRLDVAAETRAAMRLFSELQGHFGDWRLTLMAYNSGVAKIEAGIRATGSRDVWKLYEAGYGNDPDYVARTMAATLILANPGLVR
jgi:beta-lactamase regulating signal transducer with metallopeptidase domain